MASQREWISNIPPEILARFQSATIIGDSVPKKERKEGTNPLPPLAVDPDNGLAMGIELTQFRDGDTWKIVKFFASNQDSRLLLNEISIAIKQRNATHTTHIEGKIGYLNYALTRDRKRSYITKGDDGRFSLSTPVKIKDLREELAKQQKAKTEKPKEKREEPKKEKPEDKTPDIKIPPTVITPRPEQGTSKLIIIQIPTSSEEEEKFAVSYKRRDGIIIDPKKPVIIDSAEKKLLIFLHEHELRSNVVRLFDDMFLHQKHSGNENFEDYKEWIINLGKKLNPLGYEIIIDETEKGSFAILRPMAVIKKTGETSPDGKIEDSQPTTSNSS